MGNHDGAASSSEKFGERGTRTADVFLNPTLLLPHQLAWGGVGGGPAQHYLGLRARSPPPACIPAPAPSSDQQLGASHPDASLRRGRSLSWPETFQAIHRTQVQDFSWNVVKICVLAMGTCRSRGLYGSGYKMRCLKLCFCPL